MSRTPIIAGNWKMNTGIAQGEALAAAIVDGMSPSQVEVVLCPPYTHLTRVGAVLANSPVMLGAQDLHWEDHGAYTGKVSAAMLKEARVNYVIVGHSEQRSYFHESDESVNRKISRCLIAGLHPIVCVGETLEERKSGRTNEVLSTQIRGGFAGIAAQGVRHCVVAYEPVWAIGTGVVASEQQAQEAHAFIRGEFEAIYGAMVAGDLRIQYGGSMKPQNAAGLLAQPDIDGGLIGGASLNAESFLGIIRAA